jgi:acetate---CoA ligase (ADP-forming)
VLRPKSVAIVGASEREGWANWSKVIYDNLRSTGIGFSVYPVNPQYAAVWGNRCYPSLDRLPQPVDLALVVVPASEVLEVLHGGAAAGISAAIVYSSGVDARLQSEIVALCANGLRLCGPNSMGTLSLHERLLFYPSNPATRVRALPAGDVGVVFQSGGTAQSWLQQAAMRGLGFSYVVTSGDELDLDLADYVDFMVEDERTRLICCAIESIGRPEAFVEAARRSLSAGKPLCVVKAGRNDDGAVFDAVCQRYGIVRCESLDDLTENAVAFAFGTVPSGPHVAILVTSSDVKAFFLDAARTIRLDDALLVEHPLDAGISVPYDESRFASVCAEIAGDPGIEILAVPGQLPTLADDRQKPDPFREIARASAKPVVAYARTAHNVGDAGREFQRAAGIPFVQGIPQTARVLRALVRYGARRRLPPVAADVANVADGGERAFEEVLAAYSIPSPRYRYAASPEAAVAAAREFGYPVVLKAVAPQIVRPADEDAVRLRLEDGMAVQRAAIELANNLRAKGIGPIELLVQEMLEGPEIVVRAREDARFGPFIAVAFGGPLAEMIGDVCVRLLPIDQPEARAMLEELQGAPLLRAFRGRPARDVDALTAAIAGVSRFYLERRTWIREIEIDPMIVLAWGEGVRAAGVRLARKPKVPGAISL